MTRAGIVRGYKHICRRCKANRIDSHEDAPDGTIRRCPKCNAKMWPSPVPKPCTFHELRHTDAQVTTERYAHLVPGYLQAQIGRLKLTGFASPLLPPAANDEGPAEAPDRNDQDSREDVLEREARLELATLSLGTGATRPPPTSPPAPTGLVSPGYVRPARPVSPGSPPESPPVSYPLATRIPGGLPGALGPLSPLTIDRIDGSSAVGAARFLTPAQVAEQLGVCRATIYALTTAGRLEHVRVGATIRIPRAALVAYLDRQRGSR